MDLLGTLTCVEGDGADAGNRVTYFMHTLHGRRVCIADATLSDSGRWIVKISQDWYTFLSAANFESVIPSRMGITNRDKLESYFKNIGQSGETNGNYGACLKFPSASIHQPDVTQSTIAWFVVQNNDLYRTEIPRCMSRHLFEHAEVSALLAYGNQSWSVEVNKGDFALGFDEFMDKVDVPVRGYVLFRHVGNFKFETFVFDNRGNKVGPITNTTPASSPAESGDSVVIVQSAIPKLPYEKLFYCPSFFYIPHKKSAKHLCNEFLRSCCNPGSGLVVLHGTQEIFVGEEGILEELKSRLLIPDRERIVFFNHEFGRVLTMVIDDCDLEFPPPHSHHYMMELKAGGRMVMM